MSSAVLRLLHLESAFPPAKIFEQFDRWISIKSLNTQRAYKGIMQQWCKFLGREYETERAARAIVAARYSHAYAYKVQLVKQGKSGATIKHRIVILKAFYDHLMRLEILNKNPFEDPGLMMASNEQLRPTGSLTPAQVRRLLSLPNEFGKEGIRDRAMLSLLFGGALRRSEISNLLIGDCYSSQNDEMWVQLRHTKSAKTYKQSLPDWAQKNLKIYHEQRLNDGGSADDALFVRYRHDEVKGPLLEKEVYRIWKRYTKALGLKVSPHAARASAITKLLDQGFTHREVQQFSRHASVTTVEKYDKRRRELDTNPGKKLEY